MVLKRTFVHTYVGGRKADLPREVGSTPEGKVNATAQNAGFLLKELRQELAVIYPTPHQRKNIAQGRFQGGSYRRAEAQRDRQFFSKPNVHQSYPLFILRPTSVRANRYLSLSPTRHDLTQGQKPEGRLKWG